jgi:hypothetical protein
MFKRNFGNIPINKGDNKLLIFLLMNNIIMKFLIFLIEYICGEPEIYQEIKESVDSGYFLYDLETQESISLYE